MHPVGDVVVLRKEFLQSSGWTGPVHALHYFTYRQVGQVGEVLFRFSCGEGRPLLQASLVLLRRLARQSAETLVQLAEPVEVSPLLLLLAKVLLRSCHPA